MARANAGLTARVNARLMARANARLMARANAGLTARANERLTARVRARARHARSPSACVPACIRSVTGFAERMRGVTRRGEPLRRR